MSTYNGEKINIRIYGLFLCIADHDPTGNNGGQTNKNAENNQKIKYIESEARNFLLLLVHICFPFLYIFCLIMIFRLHDMRNRRKGFHLKRHRLPDQHTDIADIKNASAVLLCI